VAAPKVAIYARVSKADRDDPSSIPVQLAACRKRAEAEGWEVVDEYTDHGVSAWNPARKRPAFERLLAVIEAGSVDTVLVREQERLLRKLKDGVVLLKLYEAGKFLRVACTMESDIDLTRARDRKDFRDRVSAAIFYSDFLSEKVRETLSYKATNGEWRHGGLRPFGYQWSDEKHTLVPFEPEAALVREAAKRILDGESRRRITRDWHERGLRTSKDKPWSITRLADLMRSPTIAGLRTHKGEVVAKGNWEPLIDRKTWEAVGKHLRRVGGGHRGRQRHLLTGLVVCGKCGQPLSAKARKDRDGSGQRRYVCLSDKATSCGQLTVLAEPVERIVLDTAWFWFEPEPFVATNGNESPEMRAVENALTELKETQANLSHDHYTEKLIPRSVFLQEMRKLRDEEADLERQLRKLEKNTKGLVLTRSQFESLVGPPQTLTGAESEVVEYWRSIIQTVFEKVIIRPAGKGRRFTPERVELVPRPEYRDADYPVLPDEEGAA
jgi:site-specific DNA recombinase